MSVGGSGDTPAVTGRSTARIEALERERSALIEELIQTRRELEAAKAAVDVKAAYIAEVEAVADETARVLRTRTTYVLQQRLKAIVAARWRSIR